MVTKEHGVDGHALVQTLNRPDVTHFQATPSTFRILLECGWGSKYCVPLLTVVSCFAVVYGVCLLVSARYGVSTVLQRTWPNRCR